MSQISQDILRRVTSFISSQNLLPKIPATVFVGLSGGPDSVCLLHILHKIGYDCKALHCNFHLRGEESQRDQKFCKQLCEMLDIDLKIKEFNTHRYMAENNISLEMAARNLRYKWWASVLSQSASGTRIALGHHLDDSIETALMNLMRGTGIHGLTGIVAYNADTQVVRPLLCLSRKDVIAYLNDNDLSYIIDSTNAENDTLRNQIRNQLIPLMEEILPQARKGISQTIEHLQGTAYFSDEYLKSFNTLTIHYDQWGVTWDELGIEQLRLVLPEQRIEDFIHFWKERHCSSMNRDYVRTQDLLYSAPLNRKEIEAHRPKLSYNITDSKPQLITDSQSLTQSFDASSVRMPLVLRRWQEGDRIAPLGMNGHTKLLSDLFSNAHYSPMQKATTWLVTDASGTILWVAGLRISELHKVTPETEQYLTISLK